MVCDQSEGEVGTCMHCLASARIDPADQPAVAQCESGAWASFLSISVKWLRKGLHLEDSAGGRFVRRDKGKAIIGSEGSDMLMDMCACESGKGKDIVAARLLAPGKVD
eukprot:641526-Pelagomonas_calceolata.AAC.1